ncbi:hypothetical protein F2Q70_00023213 [Brassica cretica]|uniref:Uncharacterized protein n=1 Tax=Brassica cretica TaxID=69181 RepID=A0A8S9GUJ1_BRACR|nr:hypothetical protein F2Q70_00023213 [Brassica cretica]
MEEASSSSIDSILEFLRKNRFMRAEAALISELSNNSSSSNGVKSKVFDKKQGRDKNQVSDELVVKEIQCGSAAESHHQQMNDVSVQTQSPSGANNSSLWEDRFTFSESLVDTELDLPPWNHADSEVYNIDPTSPTLEDDSMAEIQEGFITTSWPRSEERAGVSSDQWKDCSVTTVYPLSKGSTSTKDVGVPVIDKRQGKKKVGASSGSKVVINEHEDDDVETALYLGKSHSGYEAKNLSGFEFSLAHDGAREDLPRLPHVRIKSEDKSMNYTSEEKHEQDVLDEKLSNTENGFFIGSYQDVPIGQEIHSSGGRVTGGGNWLSVSQGLTEDASDLIFGFGNGLVDYPSENDKDTEPGSVPDTQDKSQTKNDDEHSFAEEDSYFSGEQYVLSKGVEPVTASDDPMGLSMTETYSRTKEPELLARYDGKLMHATELRCRLWLHVFNLFGRFTLDSIFTASDLAFLALVIGLGSQEHQMARLCSGVIHTSVLRQARLEVAVLPTRPFAGILGGFGECLLLASWRSSGTRRQGNFRYPRQ